MPLTFPRRLRLLGTADFDRVFANSQRSADNFFTILYCSNARTEARLGFVLSKKRVRLAVARNRLRRLVRESFRHRVQNLPPLDVVVMARDAAGTAANRDIFASLDRHWTRIEARCSDPQRAALPPVKPN